MRFKKLLFMTRKISAVTIFLFQLPAVFAQNALPDTAYALREVVVIAGKERAAIDNLPVAATLLMPKQLERGSITSPSELSAIVPNFFMPDYGSKLTAAAYIRGVGSRMNEPAVALYVDNVPYIDRSSFDFDFFDVAKIEVLRGPQGTLYGRNAMGGVINVYTSSPVLRQGTKVQASYGSAGTVDASLLHARKLGKSFGISVGGAYRQTSGFFTNAYNGKPGDALQSGTARLRLDWIANHRLRLSYALNSEYSNQEGYPYGAVDSATGRILGVSYNDPAGYRRLLASSGLSLLYEGSGYTLSSATSYQLFCDHMQLDQDFSPANFFTLEQKQRQHAVTEELIVKSKGESRYQWLFGVFGFYKNLSAAAPVNLKSDMIGEISKYFPASTSAPAITIVADSGSDRPAESIRILSDFGVPAHGFATFHQSTCRIAKGLSATVGLRLDYERVALRYLSSSQLHVRVKLPAPAIPPAWYASPGEPLYDGSLSNDFLELLPKLALQYEPEDRRYKAYATAAKGYTSGGYNTNLFADLVRDKLTPVRSGAGMDFRQPESSATVESITYYKPEYCWSYEAGGRSCFFGRRLRVDASLFFVDTRSQQIAQFVPSGYGRMMKNAGRSESYGADASLSGNIGSLAVSAAYGYTHATFTQYTDSVQTAAGAYEEVSYKGRFVPFAPRHTVAVGGEYTLALNRKLFDRVTVAATYTGAGKIYFTQANDSKASQDFYSLLNANVFAERGMLRAGVWAKNLLSSSYKVFYFESMGRSFAQKGRPLQAGVEVMLKF